MVLQSAMKRLNQRYACAYNARHKRHGHAVSERYLSVPVKRDEQLLTAYRYVVRNPSRGRAMPKSQRVDVGLTPLKRGQTPGLLPPY